MGKKNKKQAKQNSNRVASRIRDWNAVDAFENRPAGPMRDRRKRRNEDKGRQAWRYGEDMEE